MQEQPNVSRRKALKLLVGAPMLPLGAFSVSTLLAGCGGDSMSAPATSASFKSASFASMAAPSLADTAAMATTTVGSTLTVSYSDGTTQAYKLAYQPFFVTGDMVPNGSGGTTLAGGYYDINNQPIIDQSVAGKERQFFSDCQDGTSLLSLDKPTRSEERRVGKE